MEKIIKEVTREESSNNGIRLPGWEDFKAGEYYRVKTEEEIIQEYGHLENVPRIEKIMDEKLGLNGVGWNKAWSDYFKGKKFRSSQDFVRNMSVITADHVNLDVHLEIVEDYGPDHECVIMALPASLLTPVRKRSDKKQNEGKKFDVSIRVAEKNQEIIDEMISKVDFTNLMNAMYANSPSAYNATSAEIRKKVVENYLKDWANAKYEFYLMFGRELKHVEHYDRKMEMKEFRRLLINLMDRYSRYFEPFNEVTMEEWYDNLLQKHDGFNSKYGETYHAGMKLSRIMAKMWKDTKFDIEMSKIYQNIVEIGYKVISIDPIDYLTMSTNKNNWHSCQVINGGGWSTAGFSLMIDDSTTIAYICNGKTFSYKISDAVPSFKANSKRWRQQVMFDKDDFAILFNRDYPVGSASEELKSNVREMIYNVVSKYLNADSNFEAFICSNRSGWLNTKRCKDNDGEQFHYTDTPNMIAFREGHVNNKIKFNVGMSEIYCLRCGKKTGRKNGGYATHPHCPAK